MPGAAALIILVAAGEAHDPATVALVSSVAETVGAAVSLRVEEARVVNDAEALRVERDLHAVAVATVVWRDPVHLDATVRLHVARSGAWTRRTISFTSEDATAERGRTLGLVVASLWNAGHAADAAPAATPKSTSPPPPAPPAPAPTSAPAAPAARTASNEAPPPAPPPPRRPPSPETKQPPAPVTTRAATEIARPAAASGGDRGRRFAVGAAGIGALGVEGPASAVGAAVEGVAFVTQAFGLRIGASGRTGALPALPGSDDVGTAGAGLELWLLGARADATFALGLRADVLAIVHRVRADGDAGPAEVHDRWLPGADFRLQSALRLGRRVEWLVGGGVEVAAGATDIRKGSSRAIVATIPALRVLGETGLRVVF
jgi:hypothetical protein